MSVVFPMPVACDKQHLTLSLRSVEQRCRRNANLSRPSDDGPWRTRRWSQWSDKRVVALRQEAVPLTVSVDDESRAASLVPEQPPEAGDAYLEHIRTDRRIAPYDTEQFRV